MRPVPMADRSADRRPPRLRRRHLQCPPAAQHLAAGMLEAAAKHQGVQARCAPSCAWNAARRQLTSSASACPPERCREGGSRAEGCGEEGQEARGRLNSPARDRPIARPAPTARRSCLLISL